MKGRAEIEGRKGREKKSGFALLVVILIIAVLAAMVGEFLFGVRLHAELLSNHRNGLKCRYIGRSVFNAYRYIIDANLLSTANNPNFLMLSTWVGLGSGVEGAISSAEVGGSLGFGSSPLEPDPQGPLRGQWSIPIPNGIFDLEGEMYGRLVNERGKLNLNGIITPTQTDRTQDTVNRTTYYRLLTLFTRLGIQEGDAIVCLDSLVDWVDGNAGTEPNGAEEDYYKSLSEHPYSARNDFLQSVDEMRLVRGCTPDMVERVKPFLTVFPRQGIQANGMPDNRIDAAAAPKEVLMAVFMAPTEDGRASANDETASSLIADEIYTKAMEKCAVSVTVSASGDVSASGCTLLNGDDVKGIIGNRLQGNFDFYTQGNTDPIYYHIDAIGVINNVRAGIEAVVEKTVQKSTILYWRED